MATTIATIIAPYNGYTSYDGGTPQQEYFF